MEQQKEEEGGFVRWDLSHFTYLCLLLQLLLVR